jgi:streptogrisin C
MVHRRRRSGMRGFLALCATACVLAAGAVAANAEHASAEDTRADGGGPVLLVPTPGVGETAARTTPGMVDAMQRDFQLTRAEAIARIGRGDAARRVAARAGIAAGPAYAGDWLDEGVTAVTVAITDRTAARAVRAAGANPVLVRYGYHELAAAQARLQAGATPRGVRSYYVEPKSNRLVVEARSGAAPAARAAVTAAGIDPAMVEYRTNDDVITPTVDHHGGERIRTSYGGCTEGFSVDSLGVLRVPGFVTAGHCGPNLEEVRDGASVPIGVMTGSTFNITGRGPDRAWVPLVTGHDPRPDVYNYDNGSFVPVLGSTYAGRDADVCMSGAESQWRCGKITSQPADVPEAGTARVFTGVVQTSICSVKGDSGAPVLAGNQAQGIVIGGPRATACETFMQPINGILNSLQLKLRMPDGAPTPGPRIGSLGCGAFPSLGWYRFRCTTNWFDGTDPVVLSWSSYYHVTPDPPDLVAKTATAFGVCPQGFASSVLLRITDAQGRQDFMTAPTGCP